jgi:putative transposase
MTADRPIFVADQFIDGRRMRILIVVDDCTRECLALADTSISGIRVARQLDHRIQLGAVVADDHLRLAAIGECNGRTITKSLGTTSRLASRQNAFAESFISRLRDELLQQLRYLSIRRPRGLYPPADLGEDFGSFAGRLRTTPG